MFCKSKSSFFQTLANQTNQIIILSLIKKPKTVTEIVESTKIEQSKVSHALKRLLDCKLVKSKQKGKNKIYQLNKETVIPLLNLADKHAKKMCDTCKKIKFE